MVARNEPTHVKQHPVADHQPMVLEKAAIDAARRSLDQGAVTPHYGPWRKDIIGDKDSTTRRLLEDILSDEQEHAEELKDWLTD